MVARQPDSDTLVPPRPNVAIWVKVARPFTLTAAISPVLVGTAVAGYAGTFHFFPFLVTLLASLLLQVGANYFNEYFDYRYGLDHAGSLGASTVIFRNEMSATQVLGGGIGAFIVAVLLSFILIAMVGPVIILFGLAGMAIAYFYSAKPFQFSARGLGDVLVYLAMGLLMTWGAYFVQIHHWSWSAFAASIPVGCLVVAILNMNNTRDYQDDIAVHKLTLPVRFGQQFGKNFHAVLLYGAYIAILIFVITGLLPLLSLLVWITFPLAYMNVQAVLHATDRQAFVVGIKNTAQLHLRVGLVLAAAITIAAVARMS